MNEKLRYIQQKLNCPKSQYNSFGNYSYRSCEDILNAVKPLLEEKELTMQISDELVQIGERYYIKATVILTDGNEGITNIAYAREEETKKGMDGSQITGASSSYARKYALNGLFLIDDVKDSDTTNQGEQEEPTIEDGIRYIINFGKKYPGKLLSEVYESDSNYIDWIYENMKDNTYLIKCIDLLDNESKATDNQKKEQAKERLQLLVKFNKLIIETNTEIDELYSYYNVRNNTEMTDEQLSDAIGIMQKKVGANDGKQNNQK